MFNPFTWVRECFKAAALGGIEDAMKEIQPEEGTLRLGVILSLPPKEEPEESEEESPKKRNTRKS